MLLIDLAKSSNLPNFLGFEDDAYPCNNILTFLENALSDIPDDTEIL